MGPVVLAVQSVVGTVGPAVLAVQTVGPVVQLAVEAAGSAVLVV